jgi:hypothetical protein
LVDRDSEVADGRLECGDAGEEREGTVVPDRRGEVLGQHERTDDLRVERGPHGLAVQVLEQASRPGRDRGHEMVDRSEPLVALSAASADRLAARFVRDLHRRGLPAGGRISAP